MSINDVREFNEKFSHLIHDKPVHLTKRKLVERIRFLQEELNEFIEGCGIVDISYVEGVDECCYMNNGNPQDLPLQADALVDLVYVALGTAVMLGLPWQELWDDVQRANMAKERGVGKRGNLVDCIKPEGWQPPRTLEILIEHGYDPELANNLEEHKDDPEHL